MTPIEAVARAMCLDNQFDPDGIMYHQAWNNRGLTIYANGAPRWRYYAPLAKVAIEALAANCSDEMCEAAIMSWDAAETEGVLDDWKRAVAAAIRAGAKE